MTALAIAPGRDAIARLQAEISKYPQYEPPTTHHHADGMYLRAVWCPAGTVITGKVHKQAHFFAVLSGVMEVTAEDGIVVLDATREGPQILSCTAGIKRALHIVEDAWFMTVHQNRKGLTDIGELEDSLVEQDETSMYLPGNKLRPESLR